LRDERAIDHHFSRTDEEIGKADKEKGQHQPNPKEQIGGDAAQAKLDLEDYEIQKHGRLS
jgi:hypothetical protein